MVMQQSRIFTKTTNLDFTINQQVVYQLSIICKLRGAQITPLRIISSRERTEILFRHRQKITSRMRTHNEYHDACYTSYNYD